MKLFKAVNQINNNKPQQDCAGKGILIVDDSKFSRNILKDILKNEGCLIVGEAGDGLEAIEMTRLKRPECIFMDVAMPRLDGLSAIHRILEIDPCIHIIMCTAMGQKNIIVEAVRLGAKDYVLKPYKKENIIGVLSSNFNAKKNDSQIIPFKHSNKQNIYEEKTNSLELEETKPFMCAAELSYEEEASETETSIDGGINLEEGTTEPFIDMEEGFLVEDVTFEDLMEDDKAKLGEASLSDLSEEEEEALLGEETLRALCEDEDKAELGEETLNALCEDEDKAELGEETLRALCEDEDKAELGEETLNALCEDEDEAELGEEALRALREDEKGDELVEDEETFRSLSEEEEALLVETTLAVLYEEVETSDEEETRRTIMEEDEETRLGKENLVILSEEEVLLDENTLLSSNEGDEASDQEDPFAFKDYEKDSVSVGEEAVEDLFEETDIAIEELLENTSEKYEIFKETDVAITEEETLDTHQEFNNTLDVGLEYEDITIVEQEKAHYLLYSTYHTFLWQNRFAINQEQVAPNILTNERLSFQSAVRRANDGYGISEQERLQDDKLFELIQSYMNENNRLQHVDVNLMESRLTSPKEIRVFASSILDEYKQAKDISMLDILKFSNQNRKRVLRINKKETGLDCAILHLLHGKGNRMLV